MVEGTIDTGSDRALRTPMTRLAFAVGNGGNGVITDRDTPMRDGEEWGMSNRWRSVGF